MIMTPLQYANEARALSQSLDANRFALAEHAADGRAQGVPNWAQVMAVEVGRSDKTVYEWVVILEFQKAADPKRRLRFSHYAVLNRFSDRLSTDAIRDLLDHAAEHNISAESLREMANELTQAPGADPIAQAAHKLERVMNSLNSIGRLPGLPTVFYHAINSAVEALNQIKERMEK